MGQSRLNQSNRGALILPFILGLAVLTVVPMLILLQRMNANFDMHSQRNQEVDAEILESSFEALRGSGPYCSKVFFDQNGDPLQVQTQFPSTTFIPELHIGNRIYRTGEKLDSGLKITRIQIENQGPAALLTNGSTSQPVKLRIRLNDAAPNAAGTSKWMVETKEFDLQTNANNEIQSCN